MARGPAENVPRPVDPRGRLSVLVEVGGDQPLSAVSATQLVRRLGLCELDEEFEPVPLDRGRSYVLRCTVTDPSQIEELRRRSGVVQVWLDTPIAPMG